MFAAINGKHYHLDGVLQFHNTIKDYGYSDEGYSDENRHVSKIEGQKWKQNILATITMPIQGILITAGMLALQIVRGTCSVVVGILTANHWKILSGLNDFGCALIQAIALPILGLIAGPFTLTTFKISKFLVDRFDVKRTSPVSEKFPMVFEEKQPSYNKNLILHFQKAESVLRAIAGSAIYLVSGVTLAISGILSATPKVIQLGIVYFILLGLVALFYSFPGVCNESSREQIFSTHAIDIRKPATPDIRKPATTV